MLSASLPRTVVALAVSHTLTQVIPEVLSDRAKFWQASFLTAIIQGEASSPILSKARAVELLGTMQVSTHPALALTI